MQSPMGEGMRRYLSVIMAIVWKDLVAELRSREMISAMLVFGLLVIIIFNFALQLTPAARGELTSGVLWVTFAFAGTLGLNRSMAMENDRGSIEGLLMVPVERSAVFFGKALSNLIFMLIVEAIVLPVYALLYNQNLLSPGFLATVALGSFGYVTVGTLLSAMAIQTRTRDILLPILLFPLVIPVLLAAVKASAGFLAEESWALILPSFNLIIVYDIVFFALAFMFFDFVVEE